MQKILWIDTETTGLTANSYPFQFAGIIEIDGEIKEEFDVKCRPFPGTDISEDALKVTGKTIDEIMAYQNPEDAHQQLLSIFSKHINKFDKSDKFIIAGHNIPFDFEMIIKWFKKCGDPYLGSWVNYKLNFDTLAVIKALQVVAKFPITENNKLDTIAKELNISLEFAHDAMFDIKATMEIGHKLFEILKNAPLK